MALTTSAQQILKGHPMNLPGDLPQAFWDLIERYRGELVNQAFATVGNLEDAEDVAQETLCEGFRRQDELAQAHSVAAWLRTINRANALDRVRNRRRERDKQARKKLEAPGRFATTGGFSALELRETVAKAIEQLPEDLRTILVLRYWEHLHYDQIAARLKIAPITVRRRLFEACVRLYRHADLQPHLAGPQAQPDALAAEPSENERETGEARGARPASDQG